MEIRAGSGTGAQASALTDAEGRYELTDLPAGTYTVSATKANYVRTSWGEQRAEGPGKRITLADGQRLDNINISLRRGGVVTGKIVDEFGDPVTDVSVSAMRYQYVQGSRRLMPSSRGGQTNDLGEYPCLRPVARPVRHLGDAPEFHGAHDGNDRSHRIRRDVLSWHGQRVRSATSDD